MNKAFLKSGWVVVAVALAAQQGCEKWNNLTNPPPKEDNLARASIPYEGEKVEAVVVASKNANSVAGVGHLRNADWDKAVSAFSQAIRESADDSDYRSHFGRGVAYEMKGDFADADQDYKRANFLKSDPSYNAGRLRVEDKLKSNK